MWSNMQTKHHKNATSTVFNKNRQRFYSKSYFLQDLVHFPRKILDQDLDTIAKDLGREFCTNLTRSLKILVA